MYILVVTIIKAGLWGVNVDFSNVASSHYIPRKLVAEFFREIWTNFICFLVCSDLRLVLTMSDVHGNGTES